MTIKTRIIIGAVAAAASVLAFRKVRSLITVKTQEKKEDASVDIEQNCDEPTDEPTDECESECSCVARSLRGDRRG